MALSLSRLTTSPANYSSCGCTLLANPYIKLYLHNLFHLHCNFSLQLRSASHLCCVFLLVYFFCVLHYSSYPLCCLYSHIFKPPSGRNSISVSSMIRTSGRNWLITSCLCWCPPGTPASSRRCECEHRWLFVYVSWPCDMLVNPASCQLGLA